MARLFLIVILLKMALGGLISAQALLAPPFGRKWGEEPSGLLQWADGQNLDVFVEMPGKRRGLQIFTFKLEGGGLPGHSADSVEARYYHGRLYELTVFYEFPGLKAESVRKEFLSLKKTLVARHGDFRLNGKSDNTAKQFLTKEESYHYEPSPKVFLMLAYSEVTDLLRKESVSRFSAIYHNGNLAPPAKGVLPDFP